MAMQVYADDEEISTSKSLFVDAFSNILELKRCDTGLRLLIGRAEPFIVNKDNLARSTKEKLIFEKQRLYRCFFPKHIDKYDIWYYNKTN